MLLLRQAHASHGRRLVTLEGKKRVPGPLQHLLWEPGALALHDSSSQHPNILALDSVPEGASRFARCGALHLLGGRELRQIRLDVAGSSRCTISPIPRFWRRTTGGPA